MYANTLGSFTKFRERGDTSSFKKIQGMSTWELRFAHSAAGKTPEGSPLRRHLVGLDVIVLPTTANGLTKPEKVTLNLTVTHTDGVPVAAGASGTAYEHMNLKAVLLEMVKITSFQTQANVDSGLVSVDSIRSGEI